MNQDYESSCDQCGRDPAECACYTDAADLIGLNYYQLMQWAGDNYYITQNSEGLPAQALMAGWVYAMDISENTALSESEFVRIAYLEFINMGYDRG